MICTHIYMSRIKFPIANHLKFIHKVWNHRRKISDFSAFYTPVLRQDLLCDWVGGHPRRFPHKDFSSVYRIFTKLCHMIPLWKVKNPIYFGVIRSKVKVTVTINRIFDNRVVSAR